MTFKRVLVCTLSMCCLNAMPLSYVTPRIVGNGCSGVGVAGIEKCYMKLTVSPSDATLHHETEQ